MFEKIAHYDCPRCDEEMKGSLGDNVYCSKCNKSYGTDWDYVDYSSMFTWLNGEIFEGKVDID